MRPANEIKERIAKLVRDEGAHKAQLDRWCAPDDPEDRLIICQNLAYVRGKISALRWVLKAGAPEAQGD